jgi:AcrR family transcriptional regulator
MTRQHLLAAAAEVFARRGYAAATLDEVAERAGFSKGAVYSNFSNKEDLFLGLMQEQAATLVDRFEAAPDDVAGLRDVYAGATPDERADSWALSIEFTLYALRRPELRGALQAANQSIHQRVVTLVEAQCREAGITPPLSVGALARLYIAVFSGLWQQQVVDPDGVDDDAFPNAVLFLRNAIEALGQPGTASS